MAPLGKHETLCVPFVSFQHIAIQLHSTTHDCSIFHSNIQKLIFIRIKKEERSGIEVELHVPAILYLLMKLLDDDVVQSIHIHLYGVGSPYPRHHPPMMRNRRIGPMS